MVFTSLLHTFILKRNRKHFNYNSKKIFFIFQRFMQYLASSNSTFNLSNFLDKGGVQGKSTIKNKLYSLHKLACRKNVVYSYFINKILIVFFFLLN